MGADRARVLKLVSRLALMICELVNVLTITQAAAMLGLVYINKVYASPQFSIFLTVSTTR